MRYVLGASELQVALEPPGIVPGERVRDLRGRFDHPFFRGAAHVVELDGVSLVHGHHAATRPVVVCGEDDGPQLVVHAGLRGHPTARAEGIRGPLSHRLPGTDVVYTPSTRTTFTVERDACNEAFEVNFTMPAFRAWAERYPELLGDIADRMVRGRPFRLTRHTAVTTPELLGLVQAMMDSHRHGPLRELYLEAKLVELLVLLLGPARIAAEPGAPDIDRVMEARDRLLARFDDPPTIAQLAREVGTNTFNLKRDFKAVFGLGVRAFVLGHRLDRARAQLLDTRGSVKEIAAAVGYSDVAHFSAAFRRRFGFPPSTLRRRLPGRADRRHASTEPPATSRMTPVTQDDRSDAR
jgi:AraC-like DNA-binding protein